jgi:hypothetical protein
MGVEDVAGGEIAGRDGFAADSPLQRGVWCEPK